MTSSWAVLAARMAWHKCGRHGALAFMVACAVTVMIVIDQDTWIKRHSDTVPYRPRAKFRDMSSHDKWVIVDVTSPHCQRQGRFQAPEGWKVILAREATHSNNDNLSLLYTLFSDPSASQGVGEGGEGPMLKNAAYLTAILRGARHLLDTDCSLSAVHVLHVTRPSRHGLLYNDTRLFNPYAHFGAWASVPRAVSAGGHPNNSKTYYIRDFHSVAVKHALSDTSRDAVSVLSNNGASKHGVGVTFDPSTPPVFLGQRSFAPAVAASSLYQQQALWGLLLPCVSPTPACHVLRQLVLQRLLWELDAFSAYYQLPASVVRSNLSADDPASQSPPYLPGPVLNVAALSSLLDAWTCDTNLTFYGCFRSLADLLYKEGYLQQQDHQLVLVWIKALHSPGLTEPARVAHPWSGRRRVGEVKVRLGSLQHRVQSSGEDGLQQLWQQSVQPVIERCSISDAGWLPSPALWTSPIIDDIVLIIVFNVNNYFWPNLAFLETVHRPFFKHIVYCVSDSDQLSSAREYEAWHHVILVEGLSDGWYLMYGCVTSVIQMNLAGVKGYLMIGDDTLLNTWNLFNMSRDVITQHKKSHPRHADNPKSPGWMWWPMEIGRCAIVRGLAGLEKISGLSSQQLLALIPGWNHSHTTLTFTHILEKQWMDLTCGQLQGSEVWPDPSQETAKRFLYNYYHVHGMAGFVKTWAHDFIYFPQTVAEDYISISRHLMKHRAMIEVAMNAIQYGLADPGRLLLVDGGNLWGFPRLHPGSSFNESQFYLHPFKLGEDLERHRKDWDMYCGAYLKTLFSALR